MSETKSPRLAVPTAVSPSTQTNPSEWRYTFAQMLERIALGGRAYRQSWQTEGSECRVGFVDNVLMIRYSDRRASPWHVRIEDVVGDDFVSDWVHEPDVVL